MINMFEVNETNKMITQENLDVRTITLGISLLDCVDADLEVLNENIYRKITTVAKDLVATGQQIEREYGIPIVNKRISITPIAFVGGKACKCPEDYVSIAKTLDRAAKEVGVNFIGGYSALVSKGMTKSDENLIRSIPEALSVTERVCSSVTVRYHIILGKSSPETGGEIRIPDGVYIFLHTFKYFIFRFFLGVFYFLYFIRNPFGSIYVIEFASFAACQDQHPQGCCTTEECYFIEMFHFLYFLIGNGLKRSPPVPVEPVGLREVCF